MLHRAAAALLAASEKALAVLSGERHGYLAQRSTAAALRAAIKAANGGVR